MPATIKDQSIAKMVSPRDKRLGVWRGGVIQIRVTGACDKSCFGCTQGSNLRTRLHNNITLDHFNQACESLKGYFGVVGVFGGNPAIHPQFLELCEILRSHFPKEQCGLWCNKLFGNGLAARETFNPNVSNLNVHLDSLAAEEFRRDWPEATILGENTDSRHTPTFVAMQDIIPDEDERWSLIADCDINRNWSAMVAPFRGHLRAWFCEIAGSQAILHENEADYPDTGHPAVPGWWNKPIQSFSEQIELHCHACGIPLRGYGSLAVGGYTEQVSETHKNVYSPKQKDRKVELVTLRTQLGEKTVKQATDYIGNSRE